MSEVQEEKPKTFTDVVKPSDEDIDSNKIKETIESAEDKILNGLKDQMASGKLAYIKELAPLDEFTIDGKPYKRQKIKPKDLREIKQAERDYTEQLAKLTDPDERLELDFKLLSFKAEKYLGMTKEQFEDTDIEYLAQVLEATELRSKGFR